jgi:integrase
MEFPVPIVVKHREYTITARIAPRIEKNGSHKVYLDIYQKGGKRKQKYLDMYVWDDSDGLTAQQERDNALLYLSLEAQLNAISNDMGDYFKMRGLGSSNVNLNGIIHEMTTTESAAPPVLTQAPPPEQKDFLIELSAFIKNKNRVFESGKIHFYHFLTQAGIITKKDPVLPIGNLTTDILNDYRAHLLKTKSQNTACSYFRNVRHVALRLHNKGFAPHLDMDLVPTVEQPENHVVWLTIPELQQIAITPFQTLPAIKQAYLLCCYSAMRISDIIRLRWNMIVKTEDGYQINYRQKKMNRDEFTPIKETVLVNILGEIKKGDGLVFPELPDEHTMNVLLRNWMQAAGIEKAKPITWHSSKHSCAMMLFKMGVSIYVISKMLNHKSIQTTMKYLQLLDEDKRGAAESLPNLWE